MAEPFIGQVVMFAGNFAPRGWAFCDGQLLAISQNTALFSILGTMYGGDGVTTFALPDLRSRSPMHAGAGPGLSMVMPGQRGGAENRSLSINQMPAHNHGGSIVVSSNEPDSASSAGTYLGNGAEIYASGVGTGALSGNQAIPSQGSGQPVDIRHPYLGINFIIALQGIFPSRN